jgi:chemotaxis protein methyltransferase CheR
MRNTTEFFREPAHFDYIRENIESIINDIPRIKREGEIRVWSAPCSSGEEPITISIILKECLPRGITAKILATDIDEKVLTKAAEGIYTENECGRLSPEYMAAYLQKRPDGFYKVNGDIKKCVTYRLFNLMDGFGFQKGFDIIFCRNLLMYFDADIQQNLINKFYGVLIPNGLFFIGHSENIADKKHRLKHIQTAIYKK